MGPHFTFAVTPRASARTRPYRRAVEEIEHIFIVNFEKGNVHCEINALQAAKLCGARGGGGRNHSSARGEWRIRGGKAGASIAAQLANPAGLRIL